MKRKPAPGLVHLDFETAEGFRWFKRMATNRPDLYGQNTPDGWRLPHTLARFDQALKAAGGKIAGVTCPE